eukprot:TRINITY_DN9386_c0_g1_i1.p1 TRINITY_DN9386_c0_g1~~TRINITY_DN9386_c0_g1_i1.p1  ORF type:complete len:320 (+),score=34.03 TRINITY_DN9386_c0_g1_i1:33-992(+)
MKYCLLFFLVFGFVRCSDWYINENAKFHVIPLGVSGGNDEGTMNSFLIAPKSNLSLWISIDPGNVYSGLQAAVDLGTLDPYEADLPTDRAPSIYFMRNKIFAYLISHAHLDHLSGVVLNAVDDSKKTIIGRNETINNIRDDLFNWKVWPNFASTGTTPFLGTYNYLTADFGVPFTIPNTAITVEIFPLCHSACYPSTGFLIQSDGFYILYLGDTGPDAVEGSNDLQNIWTRVAPLVQQGTLTAIFLECSYDNSRPDNLLFGHLTPKWIIAELEVLKSKVGANLNGLDVVVQHIKPVQQRVDPRQIISQQLLSNLSLIHI